jgi:hypothetical protein
MPVINGVYLKDFTALPDAVADANIIPIAISGNQVAYRTTVGGIVTDARVTGKLLTGLSVTGGDIASTDSILTAFGKVQNQLNNLSSGYVTLSTTQTITGTKTFDNPIYLKQRASFIEPSTGYSLISSTDLGFWFANKRAGGGFQSFNLDVTTITNGSVRTYVMPNANGTLALTSDIPSLSGYVTLDTDQTITGAKTLTSLLIGTRANFTSSGSGDTLGINHSSGSGIALYITKGGNGEGIYVNKSSGSGNAVTIIGTLNATTLVKSGGTSSQFLKADGSVDSTSYGTGSVTSVAAITLGTSGFDLSSTVANGTTTPVITLNVPNASSIARGVLSSADWTTFNNKQNAITLTTTGSSGAATLVGSTLNIPNYGSALSGYLPLSGGTLTGALFGTTASFASSIGLTSASSSSILTSTTNGIEISVDGSTSSNKNTIFKIGSSETMRIDASGNLGLGTTSPGTKLDVLGFIRSGTTTFTTGGQIGAFGFGSPSYTGTLFSEISSNFEGANWFNGSNLIFKTSSSGDITANPSVERMRITSGGNVGIGTTSPNGRLEVSGSYAQFNGGGIDGNLGEAILFGNTSFPNVQKNRIRSSISASTNGNILAFEAGTATAGVYNNNQLVLKGDGNVGIGTTSPATRLDVTTSINSFQIARLENTNNTSGNGVLVTALGSNCNNTSSYHLIAGTGGADKFYLYGNGTYTTVSDSRLKKDISKVTDNYLDKVLALNIVNYHWNDQNENDALEFGMIAQEVEELIPSIVHEGREDENGNKYKGIQASVLPYILIKAIQELTEKVKQLENK